MNLATPITAIAVSTAKPIAKPIRKRLASDWFRRRVGREYACAAMSDEATGADGSAAVEEGIDKIGVEGWFSQHTSGFEAPLRFERIAGGLSNLTYRVSDASGRRWALRRPPLGARLASAHDMGREHKILAALQ